MCEKKKTGCFVSDVETIPKTLLKFKLMECDILMECVNSNTSREVVDILHLGRQKKWPEIDGNVQVICVFEVDNLE